MTATQGKALKSIESQTHYFDREKHRYYRLKVNGARRYVPQGPIAALIMNGIVGLSFNKLFVTSWGNVLLKEFNKGSDPT